MSEFPDLRQPSAFDPTIKVGQTTPNLPTDPHSAPIPQDLINHHKATMANRYNIGALDALVRNLIERIAAAEKRAAELTTENAHLVEANYLLDKLKKLTSAKDFSTCADKQFKDALEYSENCRCLVCEFARYVLTLREQVRVLSKRAADAEAQVKALSRPVSIVVMRSGNLLWDGTDLDYNTEAMEREELDALIAARMSSAGGSDGK